MVVTAALIVVGLVCYFLGCHQGYRASLREHTDWLWVKDQWNRQLHKPFTLTGEGRLQVPCPYCGIGEGHLGTCPLSLMRTGLFYDVHADGEPLAGIHFAPTARSWKPAPFEPETVTRYKRKSP